MPADVLLTVFKFLDRRSLGQISQVCSRFRDIAYTDALWMFESRNALASNQMDLETAAKSQENYCARDRVKLGQAWSKADFTESLIAVQHTKFMPRLQLDSKRLWVAWGSRIWCHPRLPGIKLFIRTGPFMYLLKEVYLCSGTLCPNS